MKTTATPWTDAIRLPSFSSPYPPFSGNIAGFDPGKAKHPRTWSLYVPSIKTKPTDFGKTVVNALSVMTRTNGVIDQAVLRHYLRLASSYLVLDSSINGEAGIANWNAGFHRLVDVLVALHKRGELELDTVNEASKACSECWSVAGSWREMDESRECVREIAGKLKTLLDPNGRTYQGSQVYAP